MNLNDLIYDVMRLRAFKQEVANGHTDEYAKEFAKNLVHFMKMTPTDMTFTLDGFLVHMVGYIFEYFKNNNLVLDITKSNNDAYVNVESHLSNIFEEGLPNYPKNFDDYIYYRIKLKAEIGLGCSPESMGFTRKSTQELARFVLAKVPQVTFEKHSGAGSKFCFIATACFGSSEFDTVIILRRYRELVLRKSAIGRFLIYCYYKLSPPVAKLVTNHSGIRKIVHSILVSLAVKLSDKYRL